MTWAKRLITALLLAVGVLSLGAGTALAFPIPIPTPWGPSPWSIDSSDLACKNVPTPQMPGSGVSGWIDPGPNVASGTSTYETHSYPPPYATWDLGCGGDLADPSSVIDSMIGNWETGIATTIVAAENFLHRLISPPTFLGSLDPLLTNGTKAISDSLFTPWLPLSLTALALVLIYSARKKNLSKAFSAVGWSLFVVTLAVATLSWPVAAGHAADALSTSTVGNINAQINGEDPASVDPSGARASLLTDSILYRQWLRGELGSSDSPSAINYGSALLDSLSYSRDDQAKIKADPKAAKDITDKKSKAFQQIAGNIKDKDPAAYAALTGKSHGRVGAGMIALLAALMSVPFMLASDLLIVASLLIIRLAVILFPALAVIGLHQRGSAAVKGTLFACGAAFVNSIVFAAGAAIYALTVKTLLDPASGLNPLVALLLCGIFSVVLWIVLKPARRLTRMFKPTSPVTATADAVESGAGHVRSLAGKAVSAALIGKFAGRTAGKAEAREEEEIEAEKDAAAPRPETVTRPPRVLSDRPARIPPEDPAMRYRFPHTPVERAQAVPTPDEDGRYIYPHEEAEDIYRPVPNVLVSREPRHEPVEIYTPVPHEPVPVAAAKPSYAPISQPLITRPKPHEADE
jgi:hypothetical protein